jgi:Mor family transcriptional regulator
MNTKWHPGMTPTEREKRDDSIREKYAMGWTWKELADHYDLSKPRIRQIVLKP